MSDITKTIRTLISRVQELEETNLNNVANYQLQVNDLEERLSTSINITVAEQRVQEQYAQVVKANDRIKELEMFLRNREATLKQSGDDWVKAKTELDTARKQNAELTAAIKVKDEALFGLEWADSGYCPCCKLHSDQAVHSENCFLVKALSLTPPDALKEYLKETVIMLSMLKSEIERIGKAQYNGLNYRAHFRSIFYAVERMNEPINKELSRLTGGAK